MSEARCGSYPRVKNGEKAKDMKIELKEILKEFEKFAATTIEDKKQLNEFMKPFRKLTDFIHAKNAKKKKISERKN